MRSTQMWAVKCTGGGGQYNDPESYSIVDFEGNIVVKNCSNWREQLDLIVLAHNKCMVDMEKDNG